MLRQQPLTAYQIGKFFEASPVHTFNTSKGKLYPLIHRLQDRGLLRGEEVPGDHRGTQRFYCTEVGEEVLKRWVLLMKPEHELLHDPLRKKLQAFPLLTKAEQLLWLDTSKAHLEAKLEKVEGWSADLEGPFGDLVKDSAKAALESRIAWLQRAGACLGG